MMFSSGEGEWKMTLRGAEFSSFFMFLKQPMIDLEARRSSYPVSSNTEQANVPQNLGKVTSFSLLCQTLPSFTLVPDMRRN